MEERKKRLDGLVNETEIPQAFLCPKMTGLFLYNFRLCERCGNQDDCRSYQREIKKESE